MTEATWIALIALFSAVGGPFLLSWRNAKNILVSKQQDWDRQDKVAKDLLARQEVISKGLEEVASKAATTSAQINGQLRQIHTLVNNNMTKVLQGEQAAIEAHIVTMRKIEHPSPEDVTVTENLVKRAAELKMELAERAEQLKAAESQA